MSLNALSRMLRLAVALSACLAMSATAWADFTGFTPGNIVVMRGGDATFSQQTYAEVPAFLDEYSISVNGDIATASLVGSFPIPPQTLTLPGFIVPASTDLSSHEGRINLSGDGHYLDFAGYKVAPSTTNRRVNDGSGGSDYYQIGQVSGNGVFTSTALDGSIITPQYVRAAYSIDGQEAWVASKYIPGAGTLRFGGGLHYVTGLGGASPTTIELQGSTDWRDVKIVGGQLYGGTGSSSVGQHGFYSIGTGIPIDPTPPNTLLGPNSNNSASSFSFVTLPGGNPINGTPGTPTVVYTVGDPSTGYLGKLYLPTGNTPLTPSTLSFTNGINGTPATLPLSFRPEGVFAKADAANSAWIDLYVQAFDGVYFGIDKSGTANGSIVGLTFTKIISNTSDTAFYGLAPSPSPVFLKGDINLDNKVDALDIPTLLKALTDLNYYRNVLHPGLSNQDFLDVLDVNSDGSVTNADIQSLLNQFAGAGSGSVTTVPEPASGVLAIVCLAAGLLVSRHGARKGFAA
jgi:hypothetical protein